MGASGASGQTAAYFDVDGTLVSGNIVRYYIALRTRSMSRPSRLLWTLAYLPQVARLLLLDTLSRGYMNEVFYRSYAGLDAEELRKAALADYPRLIGRHLFPAARERVAAHRAQGHRIVLLTGSLDFLIQPLATELGADDLIAVSLEEREGRFTGAIRGEPLAGSAKRRALLAHAAAHAIDLAASWAYGDSIADRPLLEAVAKPVAVNPGRRLRRIAHERGWPVERWKAPRAEAA